MDQSPNLSLTFHVRIISIMTLLLIFDLAFLGYSIDYTIHKGASMMIVFGFEVLYFLFICILNFLVCNIDLHFGRVFFPKICLAYY